MVASELTEGFYLYWDLLDDAPDSNRYGIEPQMVSPNGSLRLEKWNRILGIICLLISILTSIKLYYQKASVRTDAGQMPDRCSFFNTV